MSFLNASCLEHAPVAFRRALAACARTRFTKNRSVFEGSKLALEEGKLKDLLDVIVGTHERYFDVLVIL